MTRPGLPAHDVADLGLAAEGVRRITWAEREMPVLRLIRERFERQIQAIVAAGPCPAEPTTVIDLSSGEPVVVRAGRGDLTAVGLG